MMFFTKLLFLSLISLAVSSARGPPERPSQICSIRPLGAGKDDTNQVMKAISDCGRFGTTTFEPGNYNITRKMTWNLVSSTVNLRGFLSFNPDIEAVFIQSQASYFLVKGNDFTINAFNTGGIKGNGQSWWSYFATRTRADGDGRPISLTVVNATRARINGFRIEQPPFWSSAIVESKDVVMDGMYINATNEDPLYIGKKHNPNLLGTDTYRSDKISLLNWDVTCGDDCLAIKGNSTNILVRNITCRGGNGIAFGSLGQYANLSDNVHNVTMQDILATRIDPNVQPNMANGVYFKSWTGSVNGAPPTGGGGGTGTVRNISIENVVLDRVNNPIHLYQTNGGHSTDLPSTLSFGGLRFSNWTGTAVTNKLVDIECSPAAACSDITFSNNFDVTPPTGQASRFICVNVVNASCNATGQA
ncbi:pectin lyase-like protein [Cyathus striatus]|nr:pectin lyase-like protein [Cyathus striatus]